MSSTKLTREWTLANVRLRSAKRELARAECAVANTASALGNHLAPSDMKPGENIAVWVRFEADQEAIVVVVKKGDGDFELSMRGKRPVPQ